MRLVLRNSSVIMTINFEIQAEIIFSPSMKYASSLLGEYESAEVKICK